jgi:hypothetical protein
MIEPKFKVVIEATSLSGEDRDWLVQRVATVYVPGGALGRDEYRVTAPPKATGDALEWADHFIVRRPGRHTEIEVTDGNRVLVIKAVREELERIKRDENRPVGMNPDGIYYDAHICLKGHVRSSSGFPLTPGEYCTKCGSLCLADCPECNIPIRGQIVGNAISYYRAPAFCHKCGHPYPWMKDRLETARSLLYHDDKLTEDDRKELWVLLKDVMSDPKSDLAPAKRKLIDFKLAKAVTREAMLDLLAKYFAEMSKP